MAFVLAVQLDSEWAAGVGLLGLFGGLAALFYGGGRKTGKARSMVVGGTVGLALFVIGVAFTPTEPEAPTRASENEPEQPPIATMRPPSTTSVAGSTPSQTPTAENPTATPTRAAGVHEEAHELIVGARDASDYEVNLDNLAVVYRANDQTLFVSIQPKDPDRDTQLLSNASSLSVIVSNAIWSSSLDVETIELVVYKDANGTPIPIVSAVATRKFGRSENWENFKATTRQDNKTVLCMMDFYSIDQRLWSGLFDKGCMLASDGGVNQAVGGRTYEIESGGVFLQLQSKRQVDIILFYQEFMAVSSAADNNLSAFQALSGGFADGHVSLFQYYNDILRVADANESLSRSALALSPPPGLEETSNGLFFALSNRADGIRHLADFLNTGDLESQRKGFQDLDEANSGILTATTTMLLSFVEAGLDIEAAAALVTCETDNCSLTIPSDPSDLFRSFP